MTGVSTYAQALNQIEQLKSQNKLINTLSNQLTRNTNPLQLPPPGMQHPPVGRNLDQEAPIPQEVEHLAVGVAGQAGVGRKPRRSGFRRTH